MNGLPEKTLFEKFFSGSSLATILVALIGQATFSIVYQIKNNEQQAASIEKVAIAQTTLRNEIVNLQTPLSMMVLKMEGRLAGLEAEQKMMIVRMEQADAALHTRIEAIDRGGTRALEVVVENQKRVLATLDRMQERMNQTDARVNDVQGRGVLVLQNNIDNLARDIKRLDELQVQLAKAFDAQTATLQELVKLFAHGPGPK
jgi:hypothetical protein